MPRTEHDFGKNSDQVYNALETESVKLKPRTLEEMTAEAQKYRQYFNGQGN